MSPRYVLLGGALSLITLAASAQPSTTAARNDGTILLNGEPFFPFGMYPRLEGWRRPGEEKLADLKAQRDAGFNVAHIAMAGEAQEEQFGYAAANGLYLYASEPYGPSIVETAPYLSQQAALFAYEICDDCDNGQFRYDTLEAVDARVRAVDPDHLTYLTHTGYTPTRRDSAAAWMRIGDMGSPQVYPVTPLSNAPNPPEGLLYQAYEKMLRYQRAGEAAVPVRPALLTAQAFRWDTGPDDDLVDPDARYPTPEEARNMIYGGVAAGARGVSVYNYHPRLVTDYPALWSELQAVNAELQGLRGPLLDGAFRRVDTGNPLLVASYWVYEGQLYVLVVNLSTDAAQAVDLALPPAFSGALTPLSPRLPALLTRDGARLRGSLPARGVQAYRLGYGPGAGDPTAYYRIVNRADGTRRLFQHTDRVNYGDLPPTHERTHWAIDTIARAGGEVYRLRNRLTGDLIATSDTRDYAEARAAGAAEATAEWSIVPTDDGFVRLASVADPSAVLHTENARTYAQFTPVPEGFWTGQWRLEPVADVIAPTPARDLVASEITEEGLRLDWTRAGDDFAGVTYEVLVDGAVVGTTTGASYAVAGLTCGRAYGLGVVAVDAAGNRADAPAAATATTAACNSSGVLTVSFLDVAAEAHDGAIEVTWFTTAERDNARFVLERRTGSEAFRDVANVYPTPTNRYGYRDGRVIAGEVYLYRVRQEDRDGDFVHSATVSARATGGEAFAVWPNPATEVATLSRADGEVRVYDAGGRLVDVRRAGRRLDVSGLAAGTYWVALERGGGEVARTPLVVR